MEQYISKGKTCVWYICKEFVKKLANVIVEAKQSVTC